MNFGYKTTFQLIDKGNIEVFGPSGSAFNFFLMAKKFSLFQNGLIANYALSILL
jgi:hypothetical protein